jgi:hypothetical protein
MAPTTPKPKKLWGGKPQVFISATDLIIKERYYALAQTLGAYVELVPAPAPAPKPDAAPATPTKSSFGKTVATIFGAIMLILLLVFVVWWLGDTPFFSGSGNSKKYRLVLVHAQSGPVSVLEHTNQKKLTEIASQVNQILVSRGITPQTGYANTPNVAS